MRRTFYFSRFLNSLKIIAGEIIIATIFCTPAKENNFLHLSQITEMQPKSYVQVTANLNLYRNY